MIKKVQIGVLFTLLACGLSISISGQTPFINEIHYDNSGADVGEGIEIAGVAGTPLACYQLIPYNGSGGTTYSITTLSGTIDDEGCGYGAVWFPIASLQNGAPDGICLYNSCTATVIQFLSYEGSFTATNGAANGMTSTNIGVTESGSTLVGESLQLTGTGTTYPAFGWNAATTASAGTINTGQDFCTACVLDAVPTTEASASSASSIGCNAATLTWTNGNGSDRIVVIKATTPVAGSPTDQTTYVANTTFGAGGTIAANEFVIYKGSGSTVTVSGLAASTTYHIAIFEFNGADCEENFLTGSPETAFFTTAACATCPYLTGVLINACDGSCTEGENEMMFLNSGDYVIPVNPVSTWNLLYGSTNPPTTTYVDNTTANAAAITDLDLAAGCPGLFIDASIAGSIPTNSSVVVVNQNICASSAFDFSPICGSGPIYVVFSSDANWGTAGNFANSTSCTGGVRRFRSDFTALGASCMIDYEYICANNTGTDGDFVTFNSSGGTATSYVDDDCTIQPTILPFEVLNLTAKAQDDGKIEVAADILIASSTYELTLEHANEDFDFEEVRTIPVLSNTQLFTYSDAFLELPGPHHYRIKAVKNDGAVQYSNVASVILKPKDSYTYTNADGFMLHLEDYSDVQQVRFIDLAGRALATYSPGQIQEEMLFSSEGKAKGIYFIQIHRRSGIESLRIQL